MRDLPSAIDTLLAARRTSIARVNLLTITLANNSVLRWSGADWKVSHDGTTWELGPGFDLSGMEWSLGLEPKEATLSVFPKLATYQVGGVPIWEAMTGGMMDGAAVRVDRGVADKLTFGPAIGLTGVVQGYFSGRLVERRSVANGMEWKIRTPLDLLTRPYPPNVYDATCQHRLFDTGCGLNADSFKETTTVTSNPTRQSFNSTGLNSQGDHFFRFGRVQFTSGKNAGLSRAVKTHTNATGYVEFTSPFPADIAISDEFVIWPGCDKSRTTCTGKFSNLSRFKGQSFIPVAETVV